MTISITTSRLKLRRPSTSDLEPYLAYRNEVVSLDIQMMEASEPSAAEAFLLSQAQMADDGFGWKMFAIELKGEIDIIGEVGLYISEDNPQTGDLGWWLHSRRWGCGYATEAARALAEWSFAKRGLHRITASCLATNTASARIMRTLGMRQESRSIESRWLAGRWHDEVGYAILASEWFDQKLNFNWVEPGFL